MKKDFVDNAATTARHSIIKNVVVEKRYLSEQIITRDLYTYLLT